MEPVTEELERLARLHASGDLTDTEFEVLKAHVLENMTPSSIDQTEHPGATPASTGEAARSLEAHEIPVSSTDNQPVESAAEKPRAGLHHDEGSTGRSAAAAVRPNGGPKKGYLPALLVVGVVALVAVFVIQNSAEDSEMPSEYNPYCEASDGCFDNYQAPSSGNSRRTTTTQRYVTHIECIQGYGDYGRAYYWSDGTRTTEFGLAYC